MKPFFTYYGGKYRAAPKYPEPVYDTIVEPFAGSAGYSVRYYQKRVLLFDIDEKIVGTWEYLIHASESEIRGLPLSFGHVDDLSLCQEAKWLIGWWLNKGSASPCKTPSAWMRSGIRPNSQWGEAVRERIASQLEGIRHWKVSLGTYAGIYNIDATWFIDPPYQCAAGRRYRFDKVNYEALAEFCSDRNGQVIVCEGAGADWLPFRDFATIKANESKTGGKRSVEVIWTK